MKNNNDSLVINRIVFVRNSQGDAGLYFDTNQGPYLYNITKQYFNITIDQELQTALLYFACGAFDCCSLSHLFELVETEINEA